MDIDIYQQCPCHTEKKIKFCCGKGIVGDLNQILAKNGSGQPVSALDQIERAISKMGPKDCLLTIQTHILISTGEIEKAKQSNDQFLAQNPGHPTGLHHLALIRLSMGETEAAVEALQDAMEAIKGNEIPISFANAFRIVGMGLFNAGKFVSGQAHIRYAMALKGESDPELERIIFEIFRSPHMPLVLKQEFHLATAPEGVEWEKKYVNVHRALDRGQFRKALKFLNRIEEDFPGLPLIGRGLAVVTSFLGNDEATYAAWHRYSRMDGISKLDAIEAEMISQSFNPRPPCEIYPVLRLTFELTEAEGPFELALSNARLISNPPPEVDPFQEGPAPRLTFLILNQEKATSSEGLTIETVPVVIGELLCFGKQTDRPARFEVVAVQNALFGEVTQFINQAFSEFLTGEPTEATVGESNALGDLFEWRWELPQDITRQQHAELMDLKRQSVLLNEWPKLTLATLDGRSPEDAASDPELELPLQAMMLVLENSAQGLLFDDDLAVELRAKLGLPPIEAIEFSETHPVRSPIQQQFIRLDQLSDEQLVAVRNDAIPISNFRVLKHVVPEILARTELTIVPRDLSYSMMAQMTHDDEKALEYLELARSEAQKSGRPVGVYLVQEFEYRLSRGMTEKLPDLLQTLQKNHLKDPEVEYQLQRVLAKFGLGPNQAEPNGEMPMEVAAEAPDAASHEGGIWTPDQGAAPRESEPSEPSEESGGSGLWVPD